MKIAIIPADGAVYVDDVSFSGLDLSCAPSGVHALQWSGDKGWIEFQNESEFIKPPNESIDAFPEWASICVAAWQTAKSQYEAAVTANKIHVSADGAQPTVDGAETL